MGAKSRADRHFFLNPSEDPPKPPTRHVPLNGLIHLVCKILRNVMASSAKTEIGALFTNIRKGKELRIALIEMGHPQLPTPIMTDNSMACGIVNNSTKQ
eukprot:11726928-Ditylum_brightwellii.AAC.2